MGNGSNEVPDCAIPRVRLGHRHLAVEVRPTSFAPGARRPPGLVWHDATSDRSPSKCSSFVPLAQTHESWLESDGGCAKQFEENLENRCRRTACPFDIHVRRHH